MTFLIADYSNSKRLNLNKKNEFQISKDHNRGGTIRTR